MRHLWTAPDEATGERLDRFVARSAAVPRNQVRHWIDEGRVRVNGRPAKASRPVAAGDVVECDPPPPSDPGLAPEEGPLRILHLDAEVVVLDKPAGLVVHPGAGRSSGTLAHRLLARFPEMRGVGGPGRPGIVHRLDKDTSGVLVAARSVEAFRRLTEAFARREIVKRYLGIVYGAPRPAAGRIEAPVGRHPRRRRVMAVRSGGRSAATSYRTVAAAGPISLLELGLETGRTHQIRVHLKSLGHPLVGDPLYGEARWRGLPATCRAPLRGFARPSLHAWRLAFPHPASGETARFEAPIPDDLTELWSAATETPFPTLPPWP